MSWWERKSELGLCVWDLRNLSHAGNIHVNAAGTGIMPAFGLPIPVYAPATKSAVCRELGRRLAKLLSGQDEAAREHAEQMIREGYRLARSMSWEVVVRKYLLDDLFQVQDQQVECRDYLRA